MRISRLASLGCTVALLLGVVATPAQAAPAPDQWHCRTVTGAGDTLCVHLNQFLGWWTGFTARYTRDDGNGTWVTTRLRWESSTRRQSGWLPAPDRVYTIHRGEHAQGGSWADLPSFACITVTADIWVPSGPFLQTEPVSACRDN